MLLKAQNIKKEYGIQEIVYLDKLEIAEGERIGLVGRNGAGKSTLLGILSGRIEPDEGTVTRNCEIAEIMQTQETAGDCEGRYISHMKLRDSAVKSGGERTRLAIACAFSRQAMLLLADEPTTNLDMEGTLALEKMLIRYPGAVVLVSHDRKLLDSVCNKIWEIENGSIRCFDGNYSAWTEQKKLERDFQEFEYNQYRKEKHRIEKNIQAVRKEAKKTGKPPKRMGSSEWILYKGTAAVQQGHVQSRAAAMESRLEHLEKKERPAELPDISMKLEGGLKIKARNTAKIKGLSVGFGEKCVLENVSLSVETGKKTFLIGDNGSGKTTLLTELLKQNESTFITSDARVGYFSQEQSQLDGSKSVLENVADGAVYPQHICRAVLANLYMQPEDMRKEVNVLSGGERVKTALAKLLVSGCNFLVLDEPTNHMDIYTMEGLEKLLKSYDGTVLAVSHDRKLVENLADIIYELKAGKLVVYSPLSR